MAGTLSACPREESALTNEGSSGAAWPWSRLPFGPGAVRVIQGALLLHAGALGFALVQHLSLPALPIVVSALLVTLLLVLRAPQPAKPVDTEHTDIPSSTASAELSPAVAGSGASPSPLPFIGERIVLDPASASLAGLARAAARLSRMSTARTHPWGDLMARVSHELRTPLNAVIGFSDIMQAELLGPVGHPRYKEYARHIRDSGRELLKSAEDTLAITCLLDHDPNAAVETGVDFQLILQEAWAFYAEQHGLSLEAHIPEDLEVLVERRPMRQILINLFAEAVRRSDARGTVGVIATVDGDLAQIEVFLRGRPGDVSVGQASLPICLARALLELNGSSLIEVDDPHSTWRAVTVLRCSAQSDFFRVPENFTKQPAETCLC